MRDQRFNAKYTNDRTPEQKRADNKVIWEQEKGKKCRLIFFLMHKNNSVRKNKPHLSDKQSMLFLDQSS